MQLLDLFPWLHPSAADIKLRLFGVREEEVVLPSASLPAVIGRCDTADVQINDRMASRTHCLLSRYAGRVTIRDLESRHGTWVNGRQINEEALRVGDEIWIGTTRIIVLLLPEVEINELR